MKTNLANTIRKLINKRRSPANGSNTSSVGGVTSLILLSGVTMTGLFCLVTVQDTSATSASLSLSISDSTISLNMTPTTTAGEFSSSSDITVGVNTTNNTGYKLSITANNSTNLVSGSNNLTTISSAITGDTFFSSSDYNNQWGYKPSKYYDTANETFVTNTGDNAVYLPSPNTTTGDIIDQTSTSNSTNNEYTISIGARTNLSTPIGEYSNTFTITAIANATPYTITYHENGGDQSSLPANVNDSSYAETVVLSSTTPTRTGYNFTGWCLGTASSSNITTSAGVDSCSSTTYSAGGNLTLDQTANTNTYHLYAMWSLKSYNVTVNFAGSGVSSVTFTNSTYGNATTVSTSGGTTSLKHGVSYTVTMTFSSGYQFVSWATATNGTLGSTSANPTTYTVTGTSTLTATGKSSVPTLKINFGTGIYGVMVKSGSLTGDSMGVVTTSGGTVTLTSTSTKYYLLPLYKSGYTFSSWSASGGTATSDTSASGGYGYYYYTAKSGVTNTATISATTLTTDVTSTSLTAMQNLSASTCTHAPKAVRDTRDNAVYYIQRLADGKCWMLENLRLGSTSTTALTSSNTNITSSVGRYTLPASGTVCFYSSSCTGTDGSTTGTGYTVPAINTASKTTTKTGYGPGRNYVGVYYNYCAASAGGICTASNSNSGSADRDICPAGWKMPVGGSSNSAGSYYYLYNTGYKANQDAFRYALSTPLSGYFYNGSARYQGSFGSFWSATRTNTTNMYILSVSSSAEGYANSDYRYYGDSVRCLLK